MENLYVIEFQNATIKVGRSKSIASRLAQHRSMALAMANPVRREWVSDAHEDSTESERRLLIALGKATYGNEWYDGVLFDDVVRKAQDSVQLTSEPEEFHKRLMEAKDLLEGYTGRRISVEPLKFTSDVSNYFTFDPDSFVMSSYAYAHYKQWGGSLKQKEFISALESEGVHRHRTNFGTRLVGIALPSKV